MNKKIIIGIVFLILLTTISAAWSWNSTNDKTFTVVERAISLDIYNERIDWVHISTFHDNNRNVTCWFSQSRFGGGMSCIPDSQLVVNP